MGNIQKKIQDILKAWAKAKACIRKKAKETYVRIYEILECYPDLAEKAAPILLKVSELVAQGRYVEALGYLSLLALCLARKKQPDDKES